MFMVELFTRINEEKKKFENSVKNGNPYGAIGTMPGRPRWVPAYCEKIYTDAFGPLDNELNEFEDNGKPSEPYDIDYNYLPLNSEFLDLFLIISIVSI